MQVPPRSRRDRRPPVTGRRLPGPGQGLWRVLPVRPAVALDGEVPSRVHCAAGLPRTGLCGQGPAEQGCGRDPQKHMAGRRPGGGAGIEIRFSVRCEAASARIRQSRIGDRVEITGPGGRTQRATVADQFDAEGHRFTPMAPAHGPSALRRSVQRLAASAARTACVRRVT
ncbi:DUF2690 domain-containing protein [Streptomyces sp. NPDC056468]|uniref:DUF2690 domain-containing protein n=1 Tax=Streptomyces sp. NPDC056468 TaxID=3345830 RepID=UPI00369DF734